MAVSFNSVPANLRIPFVTAEFDSSRAAQASGSIKYRTLLLGQKTSTGGGTPNAFYPISSPNDALLHAGRGSMLHRQAIAWFASNNSDDLWIGILADSGAGTAPTGTITVTSAATAAGTMALYIGGTRIAVGVAAGANVTTIAAAIVAAVVANKDLPVTASSLAGAVTLTFRHKGEVGNGLDLRDSYRAGEQLPTGVALTHVTLANGTGNPSLVAIIAAMGDTWYQIISHPYTDATNLSAIEQEMSSRFGALRMIDGVAITSLIGTNGNLTTAGNDRNSQHSVIVAQPGKNPLTPAMEFAAEVAALVSLEAQADPARPLQTVRMTHALPPAEVDLFTITETNNLLFDGIAVTQSRGSVVSLGRIITTYQTNPSGGVDSAYLDIQTMLTLLYLRYSFRNRMLSKYARYKLANDNTPVGAGQMVMTPSLGRIEAIGWFEQMQALGLVENEKQFIKDLVVQRNAGDPNRLDMVLPPNLINQLMVTAAKISFSL